ncbi:MAG: SoxR reducing system RseC family protein [Bacteroidales bacterium]|nr:SoxR reducing system RseC family protein [Bacteroidales bacterium]
MENISHPGIVEQVTDDKIIVKIIAMSACSSCHAKGMCNVADMEEKIVEVRKIPHRDFQKNDQVTVSMKKSLGSRAVLLGYIFPFVLMIATLLLVLFLSGDEGVAGLSAILILIPYYWLLYIYRSKLKSTFSFTID